MPCASRIILFLLSSILTNPTSFPYSLSLGSNSAVYFPLPPCLSIGYGQLPCGLRGSALVPSVMAIREEGQAQLITLNPGQQQPKLIDNDMRHFNPSFSLNQSLVIENY